MDKSQQKNQPDTIDSNLEENQGNQDDGTKGGRSSSDDYAKWYEEQEETE